MRALIILPIISCLTACGESGGEDFTVTVALPAIEVQGMLMEIESGGMAALLSLPAPHLSLPEPGEVHFTMDGDNGEQGLVAFRVEDMGSKARVHVTVDMPYVTSKVGDETHFLSETKVEDVLQKDLQAWAKAIRDGSSGTDQFAEIEGSISAIVVGLRPSLAMELAANADNPGAISGLIDQDALWEMEDAEGYSESGAGNPAYVTEPMLDPNEGIADASAPMDDGYGEDTSGWGAAAYDEQDY